MPGSCCAGSVGQHGVGLCAAWVWVKGGDRVGLSVYNHRLARASTVPLTQLKLCLSLAWKGTAQSHLLHCCRWAPVTLSPPARLRAEAVEQCCPSHLPGLSPQHCWARWAAAVIVFFKKRNKKKRTNLSGPRGAAPSPVCCLCGSVLFSPCAALLGACSCAQGLCGTEETSLQSWGCAKQ